MENCKIHVDFWQGANDYTTVMNGIFEIIGEGSIFASHLTVNERIILLEAVTDILKERVNGKA